jgi:hypothetical protein
VFEDGTHVSELLVQATKDLENKCLVEDRFTQIAERVCHGLELVAVVRDGKVPLHEVAKLGVEDEYTGLLIAEELIFNGEPDVTCWGAGRHDVVEEIGSDGGIHWWADGALHGVPISIIYQGGIMVDMIGDGIFAKIVEEETMSHAVLCRMAIEADGHLKVA